VLGTTLWFVVAIGVLCAAMLDAAALFGRASVSAAANRAVESATHDAIADFQNRLQVAIAPASPSGTPPPIDYAAALAAIPNPLSARVASVARSTPAFSIAYSVVPTTLAAPMCSPTAAGTGADTIAWLQCADVITESRLSLHIAVDVTDAAGGLFAHRDAYVSLRLFAQPPYSALVGRKDSGADDPVGDDALAVPAHEGDIGGDTVSGETPAPATGPPAGGTLIHVRYACSDGAGHCANATPPDPDDALRGGRWTDGNAPAP
jgi:hypothetical protein